MFWQIDKKLDLSGLTCKGCSFNVDLSLRDSFFVILNNTPKKINIGIFIRIYVLKQQTGSNFISETINSYGSDLERSKNCN
jgi:hypothetical protein